MNRAVIPSDRPEVLSLACNGADTEPVAARCAWDAPTSDDVASVQLWRAVAGSARELVARDDAGVELDRSNRAVIVARS